MLNTQRLRNTNIIRYALLIGLIVVAFLASYMLTSRLFSRPAAGSSASGTKGVAVVTPPRLLSDFTLTSHTGELVSLSDFRGRSVLMFFGYTHCPDVCPTTLANYKRVKQALGTKAADTAFVFVSVDGLRDTPDVLADYLALFDPSFIGLMGDDAALQQMGAEFGLQYSAPPAGSSPDDNYMVEHTSPSFLIDADGYLRLVYFYGTEPDAMAAGIQHIQTERAA